MAKKNGKLIIKALKVKQWLPEWDKASFDSKAHRAKPEKHFYIFSLSAKQLKLLSGIRRREARTGRQRHLDLGIQRGHELSRSEKIALYIKYGFPWSDLRPSQRKEQFSDLQKPGWLPTAIVVNILKKDDKREGKSIKNEDLIEVKDIKNGDCSIILPKNLNISLGKKGIRPLEIIDGQHRLFAFDESNNINEDYELPVVAFHGLDISWQAYLFWTINIRPKRITPSLAYDLYPLLRTEDWLDRVEGYKIYRETRAQELTEMLWAYPESPWYKRINMLGEAGMNFVTQAAWVRALTKTFIKSSEGKRILIGGLFGATTDKDKAVTIPWNRYQQAAFLIFIWQEMEKAINDCKEDWAVKLRRTTYKKPFKGDPAFIGPHSMFNTDQGITVFLNTTNDFLFVNADDLHLRDWEFKNRESEIVDANYLSPVLESLRKEKDIVKFAKDLMVSLVDFDWRSSAAEGLSENESITKLSYRGGSGYKEFRRQILNHLMKKDGKIGKTAQKIFKELKYQNAVL